jgi:hypothetical protein
MKVDAKLAEQVPLTMSSLNELALEFFTTSAPDPLHWTQNSCFGMFFAKNAPDPLHLNQNTCFGTFRTISLNKLALEFFTTSAPDPLHWTQNSCSQMFVTVLLLHESRRKTGRTGAINAQVR